MSAWSVAKRTLRLFCSVARMRLVMARVSMYSLVLFFTSWTVTMGRLPLWITGDSDSIDCDMDSASICRSVDPNWLVTVSTEPASPYVVFGPPQPARASKAARARTVRRRIGVGAWMGMDGSGNRLMVVWPKAATLYMRGFA